MYNKDVIGTFLKTLDLTRNIGIIKGIFVKIISILLLVLLVVACEGNSVNAIKDLDKSEKVAVCKQYIASQFGKDPSIMQSRDVKEDSGFFVGIQYTRSSDKKVWKTICHISGNTIVWAGVQQGVVGRWRFEDEAHLNISREENGSKVVTAESLFTMRL